MDWEDVDEVLYDGTKEEILKLQCPDCGGVLSFRFSEYAGNGGNRFQISCNKCHALSIGCKGPKPNCVEFFGNEYTIA